MNMLIVDFYFIFAHISSLPYVFGTLFFMKETRLVLYRYVFFPNSLYLTLLLYQRFLCDTSY